MICNFALEAGYRDGGIQLRRFGSKYPRCMDVFWLDDNAGYTGVSSCLSALTRFPLTLKAFGAFFRPVGLLCTASPDCRWPSGGSRRVDRSCRVIVAVSWMPGIMEVFLAMAGSCIGLGYLGKDTTDNPS